MATFPIQFTSASPSGNVPAVAAPMRVDQGGEQIAQGLGAMAQAIAKVQDAQDTMALSELNRKGDEADYALVQSLQKLTDQTEQEKLISEHESKRVKLGEKYNPRVQAAYTKSLNDNAVPMRMKFDGVALQTRAKAAKDSFEFELQSAKDSGNEQQALKVIALARATDIIGQAQHDVMVRDLPIDIAFGQARKTIDTNPSQAITMLSGMKDLSPENLDKRDKLLRMAQQASQENTDEVQRNVVTTLFKSRGASAVERAQIGQQLQASMATAQVSPERYGVLMNQIEDFAAGKTATSHPIAVTRLQTAATDIWRGTTTKAQFEKDALAASALPDSDPNAISAQEYASLMKEADTELKSSQAQALARADDEAGRAIVDFTSEPAYFAAFSAATKGEQVNMDKKRKLQFEVLAQYNRELRDWLSQHPDASGKEFEMFAAGKRFEYINNATVIAEQVKTTIESAKPGQPLIETRRGNESIFYYAQRKGVK